MAMAGCKQVPMIPGVTAYKIDIQQGNAVTQEMVAKLQPGMTRNQVRFVLGTPLLVDPFRADRWDYFYSYTKRGELIEQRRLAVYFKDDKLDRVDGDVIPAKPVPAKPAPDAAADAKAQPSAAPAKPDAEKPAAKVEALQPESPKPAVPASSPAPAGATLVNSEGVPVGSGATATAAKPGQSDAKPVAVTTPAPKPEPKTEDKPKEERGFFGRMLEKIGF